MNADTSLLLQTVLSERGCVDATLQHTAQTVPFVYRVLAEQTYYLIYTVSVVKALLHEKEAAFAHLARWQAAREATADRAARASSALRSPSPPEKPQPSMNVNGVSSRVGATSSAVPVQAPLGLPPIAPCDSLDVFVTVVGGGTCCELLLRLLCEGNAASTSVAMAAAAGSTGAANSVPAIAPVSQTSGHLLVHPSHLSVVTRQPERLARYAQRGVHCLKRHHGRAAVAQSDVVVLACPPALFRDVAHDLHEPQTISGDVDVIREAVRRGKENGASSDSTTAGTPLLPPNAVLLSCMAGVPARKVALAFHRPVELTVVTRLTPHDGLAVEDTTTTFTINVSAGAGKSGLVRGGIVPPESLQQVALRYDAASAQYREARMSDMRCNISFLRPAVLEQQMLAQAAMRGTTRTTTTTSCSSGASGAVGGVAVPRLIDFTAGHQPATAHSIDGFMDVWRLLQAYVRATFAEAVNKAATHGHSVRASSGLISVVLPSSSRLPARAAGVVEAELLPALALLPASRTVQVWDAWWRSVVYGRMEPACHRSRAEEKMGEGAFANIVEGLPAAAAASKPCRLSKTITAVTGEWLGLVYETDAAFVADLETQYQRILERQLPRLY